MTAITAIGGGSGRSRARSSAPAGSAVDSHAPQVGADRSQPVAVPDLAIAMPLDPYLTLRALAAYSGCSTRWLRERLTCLTHPLPHYRVNGKILVRRSEFDTWMAPFRQLGSPVREAAVAALARAGVQVQPRAGSAAPAG
jgi:hypothetical protein